VTMSLALESEIKKKLAENKAAFDACEKLMALDIYDNPDENNDKKIKEIINNNINPKVSLNEVFMKIWKRNPYYEYEGDGISGFKAIIMIENQKFEASGTSKARASTNAAIKALRYINDNYT